MEHFFERGAEFEADMWIAEGFGSGDAGMELLGPRWRSPTLRGEGDGEVTRPIPWRARSDGPSEMCANGVRRVSRRAPGGFREWTRATSASWSSAGTRRPS